jgi:hypothetical protein
MDSQGGHSTPLLGIGQLTDRTEPKDETAAAAAAAVVVAAAPRSVTPGEALAAAVVAAVKAAREAPAEVLVAVHSPSICGTPTL